MAWSVIGRDTWGVTARLNISFRKPVLVGVPIRAEGWVVEDRRRTLRTAGRVIELATGTVLAEAEGTFVAAPPEQLALLKSRYRLRRSEDGALHREARESLPAGDGEGVDTTETVDPGAFS